MVKEGGGRQSTGDCAENLFGADAVLPAWPDLRQV